MENTTQTTTVEATTPAQPIAADADHKPMNGVYAVLKHGMTGAYQTIHAKTKKELASMLSEFPEWAVLEVFKGKRLTVETKVRFSLN